jgi:arginyl-tRNA synthetase
MTAIANFFAHFREEIVRAVDQLSAEGRLPRGLDTSKVTAEPPRDAGHGDIATNAAMVLAKPAGMAPRAVAELLAGALNGVAAVRSVEVAGPGFLNLSLDDSFWHGQLAQVLRMGTAFGDSTIGGGERVNVEYVSANPTGPMHAGHVRGAVVGDVLAHLLQKAGFDVTREYYFNDAGTQVDVLARTTHLRYREALGEDIAAIPDGLYPGDYLKEVGAALAQRDGKRWLGVEEAEWLAPLREFAVEAMMRMIREDLDLIGIRHQVFTNERELIANGTLEQAFTFLEEKGLIYQGTLPPPKGKVMEDWEPAPLTLFRSTRFGDSTDRPLKKRDGSWAYIMPDIAYHYDKVRRGFSLIVNVLGTDHGGYVERMRPVVTAFSEGKARLEVIFNGIVKVFRDGEPVKLSKRSGNIITLREMVEQVGAGSVRFFMLTRDPKSTLDFDFAKVLEQSRDNPVFYVQYAHARAHSVLRHAATMFPGTALSGEALAEAPLDRLTDPAELALIKLMAGWPRLVENAAEAREPHRVAYYLYDLAAAFHGLWNKGKDETTLRFLVAEDDKLSYARLALVRGLALVVASGLAVFGVEPVEEMR